MMLGTAMAAICPSKNRAVQRCFVWPMQAHVVGGEGVIARESPDEDALNQCRELGEALAAAEA